MKYRKVLIFAFCAGAVFLAGHVPGGEGLWERLGMLRFLEEMVKNNLPFAAGLYILFTVAGSLFLALPGITFAVAAALLFGPVLGTFLCVSAATVGACAAFGAGRFFLKDSIKPLALKNRYLKKWLFDESGRNQIFVLMITRLVPVFPYNLQNFAYGVTDISFSSYALGSFLFMIPGTVIYTAGTAGLAGRENRTLYLTAAIVTAAGVFLAGWFLKKKYVETENTGGIDENTGE